VKEKWTFKKVKFPKPIFEFQIEFQINREKWHHLKLEDTIAFK